MLTWILIVALTLVCLLAVPVTLKFRLAWPRISANDVRLGWAFGAVRINLLRPDPAGKRITRKAHAPAINHKERQTQNRPDYWALARDSAFRQRILQFVADFWRAVRKKDLQLNVRIGLGDPADTGQLWAVLGPTHGLLSSLSEGRIHIQPEFAHTVFQVDSRGTIRFVPLQLIGLSAGVMLSPAVWRGVRKSRAKR